MYTKTMIRQLVRIFCFISFLFFIVSTTHAAERFATCDQCGLCQNNNPPGNWVDCQKCLYPNASDDPAALETLRIIDTAPSATAPTPKPGRYFTGLGCIKTDMTDFTQQGAAGNVIQLVLNIIFSTAGGIAFLYVIYGTFVLITSQAQPERINYGKRVIVGSIIGLIFCASSVLIVNLIAGGILQLPGFSSN